MQFVCKPFSIDKSRVLPDQKVNLVNGEFYHVIILPLTTVYIFHY